MPRSPEKISTFTGRSIAFADFFVDMAFGVSLLTCLAGVAIGSQSGNSLMIFFAILIGFCIPFAWGLAWVAIGLADMKLTEFRDRYQIGAKAQLQKPVPPPAPPKTVRPSV